MNIRALQEKDLKVIRQIHEEFYTKEFSFPDFEKHFLCAFVAHDDDDQIISAGGVKSIIESIVITDKRQSIRQRREALYNILAASQYISDKHNYDQIHAFIQEEGWENHLLKIGFEPTKGKALVLNF